MLLSARSFKKQNTCFTGTKVHILTQKALLASRAHTPARTPDPLKKEKLALLVQKHKY
jgi:hypothetical protein